MKKTIIKTTEYQDLSAAILHKLNGHTEVEITTDIDDADNIVWMPGLDSADNEVFDLVDQLDARDSAPERIIVLSIAGINDEVDQAKLIQWYGADYENLLLGQQYAVKMIDELELPYTIVRSAPQINETTRVEITHEGQNFSGNKIGVIELAEVISQISLTGAYLNESIGIGGDK